MSQSTIIDSERPDTKASPPLTGHSHYINRFITPLLFAALLGLYGFQLWYHATHTTATVDEPFHILAGYRYWQCGDYGINPEHPPLLKLLATLPIRSQTFIEPSSGCGSKITDKDEGFLTGSQFLSRNGVDRILVPARLAASLMSILLAALVFLAASEMFGKPEAFVALTLLVFEPNLIAHGSLVTTDMAVTAMMFAAVYALYRYRQRPSVPRLLLTGLTVGLMLASKHSGIFMLPILFVLLFVDNWLARKKNKTETDTRLSRSLLNNAVVYAAIFLIGLTVLWATYNFRYYALPGATSDTVSVVEFFKENSRPEVANSLSGKTVELIRRIHIFPESYVYGLADILSIGGERFTYLLGRVYRTGQWFYFPVAFTIKTSIALLLLLPLALVTRKLYRKYPREGLFLLLPSLAFFAISLTSGLNIGIRHILPVYPFFIIIAAAGACTLARKYRVFFYALVVLLLFHAFTAVRTAPNYIAFANDLWGGPNNTYRLLHSSNVEMGQNLKIIEEYLKKEDIHDCWLAYHGPGELARINPTCHLMPAFWWDYTEQTIEPLPPVIEGTVLLSASVFQRNETEYEAVAKAKPIAILGGSILVYRGRFEVPLAAAFSYIGRGNQFIRLKRFDEAVADGRKAVELAPNNPRTQSFLGRALARRGWDHLYSRRGTAAVND
ncbi:MAG: glycosyltransferase family 39 protein, partial [Acidobacteria bacterium]|nr:glycosyltransferase family 39 protein [Acidobacteriota bacterium]